MTLVPIQTSLVLPSLLTPAETAWLNDYHNKVRETLLPLMKEWFPEAVDYLVRETEALSSKYGELK